MQDAIDVHCHIVDTPDTLHLLNTIQIKQLYVMGTQPQNWDQVKQLTQTYPSKVIPAFGMFTLQVNLNTQEFIPGFAQNYQLIRIGSLIWRIN